MKSKKLNLKTIKEVFDLIDPEYITAKRISDNSITVNFSTIFGTYKVVEKMEKLIDKINEICGDAVEVNKKDMYDSFGGWDGPWHRHIFSAKFFVDNDALNYIEKRAERGVLFFLDNKKETEEKPQKHDLIIMDLGTNGDDYHNNLYRILNVENNIAEVTALLPCEEHGTPFNKEIITTKINGYKIHQYENSNIDVALNKKWFNSLNENAKKAIVPSVIELDAFGSKRIRWDDFETSDRYVIKNVERKVYTLSLKDLMDLFCKTAAELENGAAKWCYFNTAFLRSVSLLDKNSGNMDGTNTWGIYVLEDNGDVSEWDCNVAYHAYPTFKIDLSKIKWTKLDVKGINYNE